MLYPEAANKRGPGRYLGGGGSDGGFEQEPVVTTTATGDVTINGKVKPGSFGKFVFPLATIAAGRTYIFRYDPDFSRLSQQGKLAMVGFGLKNGNDFHIVGLRGDGSTGLDKYKVQGTPPNGWNKDTGHTVDDGGAPTNGTQAGPNWIKLITSADGTTITFQTAPDGSTWTTEYTAYTPGPFTNISQVTTFGIALWFSNTDTGPFTIVMDQFADAAAPSGPTVTYIGQSIDAVSPDPSTQTFNVGAAGTKLVVIVSHSVRAAAAQRTLSSCSIDGTNGTLAGQVGANDGVNEGTQVAITYREISTGGNITVISDWSGAHSNCMMECYTITGYASATHDDIKTATGNNPSITTLTTIADGCVIAGGAGIETSTGALTFSGVTGDVSNQSTGSLAFMQAGSGKITGVGASSSFNVGVSSTSTVEVLAAISFH